MESQKKNITEGGWHQKWQTANENFSRDVKLHKICKIPWIDIKLPDGVIFAKFEIL